MKTFHVRFPTAVRIPIVLSIPHCGTNFPAEIRDQYHPHLIKNPDDTDWFLEQLYGFGPSLGITVVSATLSRWVIDLNRDPESKPLYTDGRIITGLCPTTTFLGEPIYQDGRKELAADEIQRRINLYYQPYHQKLSELLTSLRSSFGKVLLWDCHSIRQMVPTIQKEKFPDLVLGSDDGKSADEVIIQVALENLSRENYRVQYNQPFKGGFITRHFGKSAEGVHALQLEMSKINYMDDSETLYHPEKAEKLGELLYTTLSNLGKALIAGKDV